MLVLRLVCYIDILMNAVFPIQLTQQAKYTTSLNAIANQLARETSKPAKEFTKLRTALNTDEYWQEKAREIAQALSSKESTLSTSSDRTGLTKLINRNAAAEIVKLVKVKTPGWQAAASNFVIMMKDQAELLINFVQAIIAQKHHFRINTDDNQIAIAVSDEVLLYKKQGDTEYYTLENTSTHEGLEVKDQHPADGNRDLIIRRYSTQGTQPDLICHSRPGQVSFNINKRDQAWLTIKDDTDFELGPSSSDGEIAVL